MTDNAKPTSPASAPPALGSELWELTLTYFGGNYGVLTRGAAISIGYELAKEVQRIVWNAALAAQLLEPAEIILDALLRCEAMLDGSRPFDEEIASMPDENLKRVQMALSTLRRQGWAPSFKDKQWADRAADLYMEAIESAPPQPVPTVDEIVLADDGSGIAAQAHLGASPHPPRGRG